MKRGAEKQISKLDQLSEDEETEEVPSEFRKADESTLATRKIRGLPKRSFAGSVTTTTMNGASTSESDLESSTGALKFSGFSGFGTESTTNPFTFIATTAKPTEPPPQPPVTSSLALAPTTVSTSATTTAKTLASFLGASPDASATQKLNSTTITNATSLAFPLMSSPQLQLSSPSLSFVQPSTGSEPANDSTVKYFTDLRGLNVSFVSALSKAMLEDPFADFSQLFEQYKSKRSTIQSDDKTKKPETSSEETNKSTTDTTKPKSPLSMPAPPTSFSFGGTTFGASSFKPATSNKGGGFKPSLPTTTDAPSPFKIGSTSTQPSESSNAPSNGATDKPVSLGTTTNAFSFGAKSDLPNPFKFSGSSTSITGGTAPAFGSSNSFGQPSSNPVAKPPSATPSSAFNVFGKPPGSGSIGNPVGFGFGVNTKSSDDVDTKFAPTSGPVFGQSSSLSSFGKFEAEKGSKKAENNEDGEEEATGTDGSGATEVDEAAKVGVSSPTAHDVEGEGEEEEETMHSVRLKAHRMRKADEKGGQAWVELGVGYLRLKRHKETDARRMLLRNSSTGKININFKLYPGFKATQTKKSLTFIGHDNGVAQTYNVRLPNEDQVRELKAAIEREVALIKAQD